MENYKKITKEVALEMKAAHDSGEILESIAKRYAAQGYRARGNKPIEYYSISYAIKFTANDLTKPAWSATKSYSKKKYEFLTVDRRTALDILKDYKSGTPQDQLADKYNKLGYRNKRGVELTSGVISYIIRNKTKGRKPSDFSTTESSKQLNFVEKTPVIKTTLSTKKSFADEVIERADLSKEKRLKVLAALMD